MRTTLTAHVAIIVAARLLLTPLAGPLYADDAPYRVTAPPIEIREALDLKPFYAKHVSAGGFPVLASAHASDYALLEAAYLIDKMLAHRPDVRDAMIRAGVRFTVMAHHELTTDVPEHSDLTPKAFWDRRARGVGPTPQRPSVSCGEENLLQYPGDPYHTENILIHEFAHAIHLMGLNLVDDLFDYRLAAAYDEAMKEGLWKGKYASQNKQEYFAEGAQSWFDTNRENDHDHNHVNTRAELREYDPALANLCEEVFGEHDWRYAFPADRKDGKGLAHLKGYDRSKAPRFQWPKGLQEEYEKAQREKKR